MPSFAFVMPQPLNIPSGTGLSASGNSNPINLPPKSANMAVTIHGKFTKGSLTNATFVVQALNPDGSTWADLIGAQYTTGALAADTNFAIPVLIPGVKQVRVRYASTGTTTGSAIVIDSTCQL